MRHVRYALGLTLCLLVLAGAWRSVSGHRPEVHAQEPAQGQTAGSGILDGTAYSGLAEPQGKVENWVFASGMFQSTLCAAVCSQSRVPYFARNVGDAIEFVAELHCVDGKSKFVWHGVIESGTATGTVSWTLSRWYWTIEKEFGFKGALTERRAPMAAS